MQLKKITTVCTGNSGRSPVLEVIAKNRLIELGEQNNFTVDSAGTLVDTINSGEYSMDGMKKFIDRKVGRFGLHITLETEKFKTLNIHPKNARIFPGDDFFELFKGKFIQEPKVRLNFS